MKDPLLVFCPYPTIHTDGSLLDGMNMLQSKYCRERCRTHECLKFHHGAKNRDPVFYTCARGFSVVVVAIDDSLIRINGVIETMTNTAPPKFRKEQKSRKLKPHELERWINAFSNACPEYERHVEAKAEEAVHGLHDIKSLIGSVLYSFRKRNGQFGSENDPIMPMIQLTTL